MTYHQKGSIIMSEKKIRITKSQRFEDIIAMLNGEPVKYGTDSTMAIEVLTHEMELLAKKNNSDTKRQTAAQKENEGYKELIIEFLSIKPDGATCSEVLKGIPALSDYSNQKVSALLRQLKLASRVVTAEVKGKTYFSLA